MERIRVDIQVGVDSIKGNITKHTTKNSNDNVWRFIADKIWANIGNNIELHISYAIKDTLFNNLIQKKIIKWKI